MNNRYTSKAKRKDNGEWVYGNVIINPNSTDKVVIVESGVTSYSSTKEAILEFINDYVEIILETLCQCTGLQDIEGNYIFENDIFNTFDKNGNIISTFVIIWNEIEISYEILDYNTKNHFTFDSRCMLKKCKIIGNKFDEVVE